MEIDMTGRLEFSVKHDMDIDVSYDEWRRGYVAVDMNTNDVDGQPFPYGQGRTRSEAVEDLIINWLDYIAIGGRS